MAGASLADYERAYRQAKGAGIVPATALALDGISPVALRAQSPEIKPVEEFPQKVERARETSDLMWRLSNYRTISCECGTTLRIPPNFRAPAVRCPRCGRLNLVA